MCVKTAIKKINRAINAIKEINCSTALICSIYGQIHLSLPSGLLENFILLYVSDFHLHHKHTAHSVCS